MHYRIPCRIPCHAGFCINITFTFICKSQTVSNSIPEFRKRKGKKNTFWIENWRWCKWCLNGFTNWIYWILLWRFADAAAQWVLILCFTHELIAIVINVKVMITVFLLLYFYYSIRIEYEVGFFSSFAHFICCKWRSWIAWIALDCLVECCQYNITRRLLIIA